jgi:polyphenol oxidase
MAIISLIEKSNSYNVFLTNRLGGVSLAPFASLNLGLHVQDNFKAVMANRQLVADWLNVPNNHVVYMDQVHGSKVVCIDKVPAEPPRCDAMVTTFSGIALMVLVADCVPIAFTAPGVVAVAHAGWRGTVSNIVSNTIDEMCRVAGVNPHQIHAYIGPSIGACCYNVGDDVVNAAKRSIPNSDDYLEARGVDVFFDLKKANQFLMLKAGLPSKNIHLFDDCVACNNHRFFSYRAENGTTGRFGMGAMLR